MLHKNGTFNEEDKKFFVIIRYNGDKIEFFSTDDINLRPHLGDGWVDDTRNISWQEYAVARRHTYWMRDARNASFWRKRSDACNALAYIGQHYDKWSNLFDMGNGFVVTVAEAEELIANTYPTQRG